MPVDSSPNKFRTERYNLVTANIADAPLGAEGFFTAAANTIVRIVSLKFRLTTCAVVGNRWPYVYHFGPVGGLVQNPVQRLQAENLNILYHMNVGVPFVDAIAADSVGYGPLPCIFELLPGEQVRFNATNLNAGDRITDLRIRYQEWQED